MSEILVLITVFLGSFLLTFLVGKISQNCRWLDVPNARSLHGRPTPKSGGIAFVLVFLGASLYSFNQGYINLRELSALLLGLPVALMGFLDDLVNLNVSIRMGVHFTVSLLALMLLGGLPDLPVFSLVVEFGPAGYIIGVLGMIWLINLYNFMDGIDGLAGLEACLVALAAAFFAWSGGAHQEAFVLSCLVVSVAGFVLLNLPPARIFMGDAGSNFLGFMLGTIGLVTIHHGLMNIWSWAILLGVFIVDSTMTLLRRLAAGEIWYYAHRNHAYQHAALRHASHGKVDLFIVLVNLFWLFPLAWISLDRAEWGLLLTMLAYMPLVMLGIYYKAGIEQSWESSELKH